MLFVLEKGKGTMLKSCKYCGRIHDGKYVCNKKEEAEQRRWANRKNTKAVVFRRSYTWTEKSIAIRKRDNYMCVCCLANMQGTINQHNTQGLSVHHITPINEDYNKRLDSDNLITVCEKHHELCEGGIISREEQRALIVDYE